MVVASRPVAVSVAVAATAATGTGAWLCSRAGLADAPGLLQYSLIAVGAGLLGSFVLWHRPGNRYGLTHLTLSLVFGSVVLAAGVLAHGEDVPRWAAHLALAWSWLSPAVLLPLWVVVIAAFPDGRFHRRTVRRANDVLAVVMAVIGTGCYLLFPTGADLPLVRVDVGDGLAGPFAGSVPWFQPAADTAAVLGAGAPVAALVVLADRYRRADLVVRQQIKWLLAGATVSALLQAIPVSLVESDLLRSTARLLVVLAVPLPFVAAAVAVLKHGLWQIDVFISQAVAYAAVSAGLSIIFVAAALAAGTSMPGTESPVAAAMLLALLVSYLAEPVRRRLANLVVRAFYGDGPRGLVAVAALADGAGTDLDVRGHGARFVEAARDALGVPDVVLWLYVDTERSGVLRPLAGSTADDEVSVVVPERMVPRLLRLRGGAVWEQTDPDVREALGPLVSAPSDAVATLVVGGGLIGAIACASRPREPFTPADLELLSVLARGAALTLQNFRLEAELRQRLEQIERQASEVRQSRQRLVRAQDEERRRIERDLHDGAQQQLVALAARLRTLSRRAGDELSDTLTALADDAEDAVFSLQELARGIYPSLLAARGLYVALRAHAARLPRQVGVEVAPGLRDRRFDAAVEAALYYVALEAMTNAAKHAPEAAIHVLLRADERSGTVVLEVHDDGPGFTAAASGGTGLQNMTDRIAAVGGELNVESVLGAGTWVRAEVPQLGTIRQIRTAEASRADRPGPQQPAG